MIPKLHPHTQTVAAIAAGVVPTDIGKAPEGATATAGYAVVWPRYAILDGSVADMHADATTEEQVTVVSATAAGAGIIRDRILAALLTATPDPPANRAWQCPGQPIQFVEALAPQRDDDVSPAVYAAPLIVRLDSTPA